MARITRSAPILFVSDVVASAAYFRDSLGFCYDRLWGEPPNFCICERDHHSLMLQQVSAEKLIVLRAIWVECWAAYFWIDDADGLFQRFQAAGAIIAYEPCDQHYRVREFGVRDPDGNVLAFGRLMDE